MIPELTPQSRYFAGCYTWAALLLGRICPVFGANLKILLGHTPDIPPKDLQLSVTRHAGISTEQLIETGKSVAAETRTKSFRKWAGDARVTLAIVFTDVVGSTALGEKLKDERMNKVRQAHFVQSRKLINQYKGREIKTIGDSFMAAFRSVEKALDYRKCVCRKSD
jgi:class 3 adenylate cyclase